MEYIWWPHHTEISSASLWPNFFPKCALTGFLTSLSFFNQLHPQSKKGMFLYLDHELWPITLTSVCFKHVFKYTPKTVCAAHGIPDKIREIVPGPRASNWESPTAISVELVMRHGKYHVRIYQSNNNDVLLTSQFAVWLRKLGTILIDMLPCRSLYNVQRQSISLALNNCSKACSVQF